MIGLTSLWINERTAVAPELNRRRAVFVLGKIDEILSWEKTKEQEKDARFVELGEYLCEVRSKQYWRLEKLKFSLQGVDKERLSLVFDGAGRSMAEVGLLPFARVALQVAPQVLPPYRTRFSKHEFNQPQLLAVLCLMRYEDWTFREAEVRLREH